MESSAVYSKIDAELDVIFKKYGKPKEFLPDKNQIKVSRAGAAANTKRFMASPFVKQTLMSLPNPDFQEHTQAIPVRDGEINIRIYRSQRSFSQKRPVVVMSHAGGFCLGGLDTEAFLCQVLCRSLELIVVDVDYRLCPEVKYSTAVLDIYDTVKWVSVNAATFGGDLTKGFVLCGVSGGGNLSTGAVYLAREEKLQPPLTGSMLLCTGMPHATHDRHGNHIDLYAGRCPSWQEHENAPISSRRTNQCYGDLADADIMSPLFTPLHAHDHSALPPVYYQAAGIDPWRDSAFLYTELLGKAGVRTKLEVFPGVPHLWWSFFPQLSVNKKWIQDTINGAAWLLTLADSKQEQAKL